MGQCLCPCSEGESGGNGNSGCGEASDGTEGEVSGPGGAEVVRGGAISVGDDGDESVRGLVFVGLTGGVVLLSGEV